MAEPSYRVELTDTFLQRLDAIEAFLAEAGAGSAFDDLLDELRGVVFPNLRRFPRLGRRYLSKPPGTAEALARLGAWPLGAPNALREYLHADYLLLYTVTESGEVDGVVHLLTLRHHKELSFDFNRVWPAG